MNETPLSGDNRPSASLSPTRDLLRPKSSLLDLSQRARLHGCVGCLFLTTAAFIQPLCLLVKHALRVDLDSYILLVPFISAYLLCTDVKRPQQTYISSPMDAVGFAAIGLLALIAGWSSGRDEGRYLACAMLAFLCCIVAVGFFFLGRRWMANAAFPIAFLVFLIPLPSPAVAWLENASKLASAEVAGWFFNLSGTPNLRDGPLFQFPNR